MTSCAWEISAETTVAKDMMSAMVKLTEEIEKSTSDVIDYGMVSHFMTRPMTSCGEPCVFPLLGQLIAGCKLLTFAFEEKADYMMRSMRLTPNKGVDRQRPSQRSNSREPLSDP